MRNDRAAIEKELSKYAINELSKLNANIIKVSDDLENNQKDVILMTETFNIKNSNLENLQNMYDSKNSELSGNENKLDNSLDKELEKILDDYYFKIGLKNSAEKDLNDFKSKKSDLSLEIAELEKKYRDINSQMTSKQNELKEEEIKIGKMDVRLDNLLLRYR